MRSKLVFHIDARDVPALISHALLNRYTLAQSDVAEITEIYYDTPALLLKSRGADLSLQTNQLRWIQSLNINAENNSSNFTGGIIHWSNSSVYVASGQLDLSLISTADLLQSGLTETSALDGQFYQLQEIFRAKYCQRVWLLQFPDGSQASCAFNLGNTGSATQCAKFCELEFELHNGDMLQLFDFIDTVLQYLPLTVQRLCRKEQGYALYRPQAVSATFTRHLNLIPELPINEALARIVSDCLVQIQSNQAGVALWRNQECLHQMRIGLRRLSAAERLGKKIQPFPDQVREEVKWLDTQLGKARDWDVFTAKSLPQLLKLRATKPAEPLLNKTLLRAACAKARNANANVSATLTGPRYARLILNLLRWQFCLSAQTVQTKDHTNLIRFSHQIIKYNLERLEKGSLHAERLHTTELHRLRKKIKTLRYTVDFFSALYQHKPMQQWMKSLADLQDLLGACNDIAVCVQLVHELLPDYPELQPVAHSAATMLKRQTESSKPSISKSLTKLRRTELLMRR